MNNSSLCPVRTAKFDNAKAFLILMVVLGHGLTPFMSHQAVKWVSVWLYTYHMPLFVFLGGLFAKKAINRTPFDFGKVFSFFLLGFFIKCTTYLTNYYCGRNPKWNLYAENGVAWYIFAMAAHLIIAHALRNLNPKKVLVASVALACAVGYIDTIGNTLVLSRIFVFFPFFYLGCITDKDKLLAVTNKKWVQISSLVLLIGILTALYLLMPGIYNLRYLLTCNNPYYEFGANWKPYGALLRLGCYALSAVVSFCVLALMPDKDLPLVTNTGKNTLTVYALHRQIQVVLETLLLKKLLADLNSAYIIAIVFVISVALTLLLSVKPLAYILYPCTNYKKFFSPLARWFRK